MGGEELDYNSINKVYFNCCNHSEVKDYIDLTFSSIKKIDECDNGISDENKKHFNITTDKIEFAYFYNTDTIKFSSAKKK